MENTDDEALSWAGDESRMRGSGTWSVPKRAGGASPSSSPEKASARGRRRAPDSVTQPDSVIEPVEISDNTLVSTSSTNGSWRDSFALLATGVLAGVYLLFTAAWVITALRNPIAIADPLGAFMFTFGLWLAAAAAPMLFASIVVWRRGKGVAWRLILLVLGALALIPWPYLSWVG